ncbi:MAG: YggT family protein [Acidimicrobiia bacterium]
MIEILRLILQIYLVILFARAILSWFPSAPGSALASMQNVLARLTDPLLEPLRRIVPRTGMFDLSFLVLVILIWIALAALNFIS